MQQETNGANIKTWLEANKEITIKAYIENFIPTFNIRENPYQNSDLYETLEKFSVPLSIHQAVFRESQIELEFKSWDILSDEALREFELGLK
jgi:hypothetical protein